jgi:hypothetical protein
VPVGYQLADWEVSFEDKLESLNPITRHKAGALLPLIPNREQWGVFLETIQSEWATWEHDLTRYPACLLVLYGGLAFYEYDERVFWRHFAKAIGKDSIPPNRRTEINQAFSQIAEHLGFRILRKVTHRTLHLFEIELPVEDRTTSYVGSAVYHAGIPLSFWDGFLEICEWASWQDNWSTLSDEAWTRVLEKRLIGQTRLKRFLNDNREATTALIKEILAARKVLSDDPGLSISDLSQACFLRREYFDEVPETAEFLRPKDPESLLRDRPQLVWTDGRICLRLPGVTTNKLPAIWHIGKKSQPAAATPHELILDSCAFQPSINLRLISGMHTEPQDLQGINPWGLFDLDSGGRQVSSGREQLPLHSYALVSPRKLDIIARDGFEETDNPLNEPYVLADGSKCYVTHLWPTRKFAELSLRDQDQQSTIRFRANAKIEARIFVGRGRRAANFDRIGPDKIKIEHLPILSLAVPCGYFRDTHKTLSEKFRVRCDDKAAGGTWEPISTATDGEDKDHFTWNWGKRPFIEQVRTGTVRGLKELATFFRSPDLKGDRTFSIESPEFRVSYKVYLDHPKPGMEDCWRSLPGPFLPWFLLCQTSDGMKWDDLLLAQEIIAPDLRLSAYLLRKYEKYGLLVQKGRRWMIAESRAVLANIDPDKCRLEYCGDPSVLWRFYRWMSRPPVTLPDIEVVNKHGEAPYLRMDWDADLRDEILYRLRHMNVHIGPSLWSH